MLSVVEGSGQGGVVFCDLPQVPRGPSGKFVIAIMAAVAELEAGLISERTKAALAQAKAREVKLGNPSLRQAGGGKRENSLKAAAVKKWKAAGACGRRPPLHPAGSQGRCDDHGADCRGAERQRRPHCAGRSLARRYCVACPVRRSE